MLDSDSSGARAHQPRPARVAACLILLLGGLGVSAFHGLSVRSADEQRMVDWVNRQAVTRVALVEPERSPDETTLRLPGTVSAFYTATIYARASGYVANWFKDIGARVKKGDILAVLDSPELDQQLAQAHADLTSAQANEALAQTTAKRFTAMANKDIVSLQVRDEKQGDADAKRAARLAAQANVDRLEALNAYKNIVAPFDGVVTARSLDVGDLVTAGSTSGKALFQVADTHRVRIYVRVPQAFLGRLERGTKATLTLPQRPGQTIDAVLTTMSDAISEKTRTALVQLQADNPDDILWSGAFVQVTFHIPSDANLLQIPATALMFRRNGMQVATVKDGKAVISDVKLGHNIGRNVEVLSGLSADDRVIDQPPETLVAGEPVRVVDPPNKPMTTQISKR
ncbi:efflux RND transporter periplasmic adaptor subunit [Methylobacterium sp. P31]